MFNVKMIATKDNFFTHPIVWNNSVLYEEDFENLNEIDMTDFRGDGYDVYITNKTNGSSIIINK